jgi:hypothetical protein
MQYKTFSGLQLKAGKPGAFRATIASLAPVVDHDGDVTEPGAFKQGQQVILSAYGHASWSGALPVGKGVIGANASRAWVDGEFFLDTAPGRDTYQTMKALGALAEFSYGFEVLSASFDRSELSAYPGARRILKSLDTFEVSPVLKGAGIGTGLDYIKSASAVDHRPRRASPFFKELLAKLELKAIADRLDLQRIRNDVSMRQAKAAEAEANAPGAVEFVEVDPSRIEPTKHRVASLVVQQACADLGVKGLGVKWYEPEGTAHAIARKAYRLEFGVDPNEDDDPSAKVFRRQPSVWGEAFKSRQEIWLRADIGLFDLVTAASHEVFHIYEPSDADHKGAYEYGRQWKSWAESQVNMFDSEAAQARTLAKEMQELIDRSANENFGGIRHGK